MFFIFFTLLITNVIVILEEGKIYIRKKETRNREENVYKEKDERSRL